MTQIDSFKAVEIGRLAIALQDRGRDVIHMEYGQPTAQPPKSVIDAVKQTLDVGVPGYWESQALRERLAADYLERYGAKVSPEQIFLTCGASPALTLALSSAFSPGETVAMARPGYVAYRNTVKGLGLTAQEIACGADTRFQLSLKAIQALDPLPDGLIIASPANPTGSIIPAHELREIVAFCDDKNIRVISDEIYHRLSFEMETVSVSALSSRAFIVNSFSKYFCMPGWRMGWLVVPDDMFDSANARLTNYFLTAPSLSQKAALVALDETDYFDEVAKTYAQNRDLMLSRLPELGFGEIAPPDGAFYIYTNIGHWTQDSLSFCKTLLNDTGIATTPGLDFDPVNGHAFMRFSFPQSDREVKLALEQLEAWLKTKGYTAGKA